ncbi:polysaccharide biosynthesis C-terminal domain-containing protein [Snuella lapsa]|uniref:Oligosaccharide flippase family protein n=1 Tax=Snuella lapsa TaxID=870481 RepID=A0ABP6XK73_9FLAO
MDISSRVRLFNLFLRGATIGLKFALSIIIINELGVEEYGTFGIFQSTVIIMTFIVGFDFYSFSSREILKKEAKPFSFYFKHQLLFYLLSYFFVIPFSFFLVKLDIVEKEHLFLFILILVAEHLSQELYRILILLKKSIVGTMVLFLRSGIWIIVLYVLWQINFVAKNINALLILWLFGAAFSLVVGFRKTNFTWVKELDFDWIKKGIVIALPFFVGTIMYKLIEFSGRYFLKFYFSDKEVGIFTFFSSISNILFVFVQTIVIIEIYPRLLESRKKNFREFMIVFKVYKKQLLQYTFLGIILSSVFIYPLLLFMNKTVLLSNIISYFVLLIAMSFFCVSFISHYALYSYSRDFQILKATAIGFTINIVASFLLIPTYGVLGASIAQVLSFLSLFISKLYFWKIYKENL